ncbi:MAG: Dabb family protein [Phycisphaeraceae bacterium]
MFVHNVYFWLKPDLAAEQRAAFVAGVQSLTQIPAVRHGYVGVPASTDRSIIDRSYDYALTIVCDDQAKHDAYQVDPIHDRFRQQCEPFWDRVLIYDAVTPA